MAIRVRNLLFAAAFSLAVSSFPARAADVDAAKGLARQNKCFTCHGVDKKKDGPAWKDVATKYRGNADAEAALIKHLKTGPKVKFPDGHQEEHTIVKAPNPDDIKNLVDWILSLQ